MRPDTAAAPPSASDTALRDTLQRERPRLWRYIRRRVDDEADAEDLLQDVFGELIEAYRALRPIEQVGAWLMRVARNRLIDRFRRRRNEDAVPRQPAFDSDGEEASWDDLLPDPGAGPEAAYARALLLDELQRAIEELPPLQREAFVAHEFEGESFAAMAARSGVPVNTLLARKHAAVLQLRGRLSASRDELLD